MRPRPAATRPSLWPLWPPCFFYFRKVYAEVGSALPLNGGTYTVLLNTTSKQIAAGAAVLTLLSYVATAVISASEAMHYAHNLWDGLNVLWATIGLLGLFALLNVVGITESARVALVIFLFHLVTLTVLAGASATRIVQDPSLLGWNWYAANPARDSGARSSSVSRQGCWVSADSKARPISSKNKRLASFPKTLRNMWIAVAVFNPLMSLLSLGLLPLEEIQQTPPDLLAQMGTDLSDRYCEPGSASTPSWCSRARS